MPNRIIKESITTSVTLASLSDGEERHFWRLLVQADDYGYLDGRQEVIRARAYPLMLEAVSPAVSEARTQALVNVGLLHLFNVAGKRYGHFPTWDAHQQKRAKYRKYPQVESCEGVCKQLISDDINSNQMQAYAPETLDIRNETLDIKPPIVPLKGEAAARKTRKKPEYRVLQNAEALLDMFDSDEHEDMVKRFPVADLPWEASKCVEWHNARGGSANWKLALKNWLDNTKQRSTNGNAQSGRGTERAGARFDNSLDKYIESQKSDIG